MTEHPFLHLGFLGPFDGVVLESDDTTDVTCNWRVVLLLPGRVKEVVL